ncbi:MAG TPA: GYD domain-containing protein [Vicinamibacterales bacterium]|nr:GYD domain-containing protein [Vicinamibacterales bacterium]
MGVQVRPGSGSIAPSPGLCWAAARALIESLGGRLEAFYYSHGEHDVVAICEFQDSAHALAAVMAVNASGLVASSTTPLILPADIDAAAKLHGTYRAPGA